MRLGAALHRLPQLWIGVTPLHIFRNEIVIKLKGQDGLVSNRIFTYWAGERTRSVALGGHQSIFFAMDGMVWLWIERAFADSSLRSSLHYERRNDMPYLADYMYTRANSGPNKKTTQPQKDKRISERRHSGCIFMLTELRAGIYWCPRDHCQ